MERDLTKVEMPAIRAEPMNPTEIPALCAWIASTNEIQQISGLTRPPTPRDLRQWCDDSVVALQIMAGSESIAMGTLSTHEVSMPTGCAEVCHVIVKPSWRRRYNASRLVLTLMDVARQEGFRRVIGRIAQGNDASHALLKSLSWKPAEDRKWELPSLFDWYERELRR